MIISKNKIVIFGAGKIGRSFLGQLFSAGGYEVVFVDIASPVINELNRRKEYEVVIKSDIDETILVKNVRGINAANKQQVKSEIGNATILAVSVGINVLPDIFPLIADGLIERYQINKASAIDIIIAENMLNASHYFREQLMKYLPNNFPIDHFIGLVETSIGKMVPIVPVKLGEKDILKVFAESYNTLILDQKAFKNPIPAIKGLAPKKNINAWVDRKLFIHNLGHAATAYWGYYYNPLLHYIWEPLEIPQVYNKVKNAMLQAAVLLVNKYPDEFTMHDLEIHINDLLQRFKNKALADTIYRVGCDLKRKLGPNDRLAGAIKQAVSLNLPYDNILKTLIVGFHFRARDESGQMHPSDENFIALFEKGTTEVLHTICGFDKAHYPEVVQGSLQIEKELNCSSFNVGPS